MPKARTMTHPPISLRKMALVVGLPGSTATLVLQPHPLVAGIACGVLLACLATATHSTMRQATHHINQILTDELSTEPPAQKERGPSKAA